MNFSAKHEPRYKFFSSQMTFMNCLKNPQSVCYNWILHEKELHFQMYVMPFYTLFDSMIEHKTLTKQEHPPEVSSCEMTPYWGWAFDYFCYQLVAAMLSCVLSFCDCCGNDIEKMRIFM